MAKLKIARLQRRMASSQPVTKQVVRSMIRSVQETKVYDGTVVNNVAFSTAGALIRLYPISQGDNIGNRSGDSINVKKLEFRLTAFQSVAATSCTYRLVIFSDSMGSGGSISVTEFLQQASHLSPYTDINWSRSRFKIFYDKLQPAIGATNAQETENDVRVTINQKAYFNDTSTAATNIGKNALYALVIASAANGTYSYGWGVTYTDS